MQMIIIIVMNVPFDSSFEIIGKKQGYFDQSFKSTLIKPTDKDDEYICKNFATTPIYLFLYDTTYYAPTNTLTVTNTITNTFTYKYTNKNKHTY